METKKTERNDWEVNIKRVNNGFVCKWYEEAEDGNLIKKEQVIEMHDENEEDNLSELKAMENLLYFITEHFGVYYSKHNKNNIKISIVSNDKNEQQ